jgi:hypothetical protein
MGRSPFVFYSSLFTFLSVVSENSEIAAQKKE